MTEKDDNEFMKNYHSLEFLPYLIAISLIVEMLVASYKFVGPHALTLQKCVLALFQAMIRACYGHFYINAFNRHHERPGEE